MGLAIGGAVFPVAFSITWKKQTNVAAISGALSGLAAGLTPWLVTAKVYYGRLDLELPTPSTRHLPATLQPSASVASSRQL